MLVALAGAQLCLKAVDTNSSIGSRIVNLVGAIAAGLVSLMLYQPSFTFFMLVIFLSFEKRRNMPEFFKATAIYLFIFVIYFFLFRWMLWYTGLPPLGRSSGVNLDVFGKVSWFLDTALVHSMRFNLHLVRNSFVNMFRVPVALLFLFCILLFLRREGINRQTIIYVAIIIALYFFAYIPKSDQPGKSCLQQEHGHGSAAECVLLIQGATVFDKTRQNTKHRRWPGDAALLCVWIH